jgi:hypothetical protein
VATFPVLEPATRAYDFGMFPLTEEPSVSAGIVRFRHSVTPQNYQLTLGYVDLTDAEAALIREHFQGQGGGYRSFQLPAIIWAGHTFTGNIAPYQHPLAIHRRTRRRTPQRWVRQRNRGTWI